jgi:hypothetical protein
MESLEFGFRHVDGVENPIVGAGIGGGCVNTNKLEAGEYDDAMSSKE